MRVLRHLAHLLGLRELPRPRHLHGWLPSLPHRLPPASLLALAHLLGMLALLNLARLRDCGPGT